MPVIAMQTRRLPDGGRIDRSRPLSFTLNGRRLEGYAGDTVASALIANGVDIVGRSFKYHRPRGIFAAGAEEPNAILQLGEGTAAEPNLRATQVELFDGLTAATTKGWPGASFDLGVVNDWLGKAFAAGFYYKTFMQPAALWRFYEDRIRRAAGFGTAPSGPDPDHYSHRNLHCDVLVVGAGPAGLMAARTAAAAGARVVIADEQNEFGGSLLGATGASDSRASADWLELTLGELRANDDVIRLPRTTVFGYYDHNFLAAVERCSSHLGHSLPCRVRQRLWRIRARRVVLAQGAFERPLVYGNNDRPGTMLASAVSTYIARYAVCPGKRAIVATNNDGAYQTALDLLAAGAEVAAIVDSRANGALELGQRARAAGIEVLTSSALANARGRRRVRAADVVGLDGARRLRLDCDLIAVSGGWSPAVHLHSQSGGRNRWDESLGCFVPGDTAQGCRSAGACNGLYDFAACLADGAEAGRDAAARIGFEAPQSSIPAFASVAVHAPEPLWRAPLAKLPEHAPKQFVDFQNDTTVTDIRLAVREGYTNIEHVKRYTALGFGTDQGKLGNINGMAILAETLGKSIPDVGTTTFRPAYTPVTFGACAGADVRALHDPVRKTAIHGWHEAYGAPMEVVGQWHRPWYFPRGDEDMDTAVQRECAIRRNLQSLHECLADQFAVEKRFEGPAVEDLLRPVRLHRRRALKLQRTAEPIGDQHPADVAGRRVDDLQKAQVQLVAYSNAHRGLVRESRQQLVRLR